MGFHFTPNPNFIKLMILGDMGITRDFANSSVPRIYYFIEISILIKKCPQI